MAIAESGTLTREHLEKLSSIRIRVLTLRGEVFEVAGGREWTTGDAKAALEESTGIPPYDQQLVVGTEVLEDRTKLKFRSFEGALEVTLVRQDSVAKCMSYLKEMVPNETLTREELLQPDFALLHRIVFAIVDQTGFGRGLYRFYDRDLEHHPNEADQLFFLERIVRVLCYMSGEPEDLNLGQRMVLQDANAVISFLKKLHRCATKFTEPGANPMGMYEAIRRVQNEMPASQAAQAM